MHPLYDYTVPVFIHALENTARILVKAEKDAKRRNFDVGTVLDARLYPDMFNLRRQLLYVCFLPMDFAQHFSKTKPPRVGYDEVTFSDFKKSLASAAKYLRSLKRADFEGKEEMRLPIFFDPSKKHPAQHYATRISVPDFFFHVAIAYAILRHNGVPLGKSDYIGTMDPKRSKK